MQDYRNVLALIIAVTILQLAGGILGVMTPLGLDALGAGTASVGLIAALHSIGFMVGAWFSPALIRTFGNIRVHAAGGAVMTMSFLMMFLEQSIWAWSVIRLLQGAAIALMFSSVEAWLGAAMPAEKRGSISGFYHLMAKVALIAGPFVIFGMSVTSPEPYMIGAIFLALAMMPITLTRREQPPMPDREPLSLVALFKMAPSGVFACFMAGVLNTGTLALLPVYAVEKMDSISSSVTVLGALAAGAAWTGWLISQWPAGKVSDAFDRRVVIAVMVLAAGMAAIALGLFTGLPDIALLILIGIWGAGSLSFYGVAVAHILDWAPAGKMAQAMSGVLFVWAFGSVLGPLLAGLSMRTAYGAPGLFVLTAIFSFLLVVSMLIRRAAREEPPEALQEPWSPTTPLLAAQGEIDPRLE
ncbi:MAG: MFS transporter [Pseudomonadota bacterium]